MTDGHILFPKLTQVTQFLSNFLETGIELDFMFSDHMQIYLTEAANNYNLQIVHFPFSSIKQAKSRFGKQKKCDFFQAKRSDTIHSDTIHKTSKKNVKDLGQAMLKRIIRT